MKTGDIVTVHDSSWSLLCRGNGMISHTSGRDLAGRRFRVLLTGVPLPAGRLAQQNDAMLCEEAATEQILFTRAQFCTLVSRPATGDVNLDSYPADEPPVDPLDCLADALKQVATLNAVIAEQNDTIRLLQTRANHTLMDHTLVDKTLAALPGGLGPRR